MSKTSNSADRVRRVLKSRRNAAHDNTSARARRRLLGLTAAAALLLPGATPALATASCFALDDASVSAESRNLPSLRAHLRDAAGRTPTQTVEFTSEAPPGWESGVPARAPSEAGTASVLVRKLGALDRRPAFGAEAIGTTPASLRHCQMGLETP